MFVKLLLGQHSKRLLCSLPAVVIPCRRSPQKKKTNLYLGHNDSTLFCYSVNCRVFGYSSNLVANVPCVFLFQRTSQQSQAQQARLQELENEIETLTRALKEAETQALKVSVKRSKIQKEREKKSYDPKRQINYDSHPIFVQLSQSPLLTMSKLCCSSCQ